MNLIDGICHFIKSFYLIPLLKNFEHVLKLIIKRVYCSLYLSINVTLHGNRFVFIKSITDKGKSVLPISLNYLQGLSIELSFETRYPLVRVDNCKKNHVNVNIKLLEGGFFDIIYH